MSIGHGAKGRKRLAGAPALALLAALSLGAALSDGARMHRSFDAFKRALAERDGGAAVALLSAASLEEWAADRASGLMLAAGLPSGFRAGFLLERGEWRLDLPSSLVSAGRVVSQTARASGLDETAVILNLIGAASGEPVGPSIWSPLL